MTTEKEGDPRVQRRTITEQLAYAILGELVAEGIIDSTRHTRVEYHKIDISGSPNNKNYIVRGERRIVFVQSYYGKDERAITTILEETRTAAINPWRWRKRFVLIEDPSGRREYSKANDRGGENPTWTLVLGRPIDYMSLAGLTVTKAAYRYNNRSVYQQRELLETVIGPNAAYELTGRGTPFEEFEFNAETMEKIASILAQEAEA